MIDIYLFYGWFLSVLLPVVSVLLGVGEGDGDQDDGGEHGDPGPPEPQVSQQRVTH